MIRAPSAAEIVADGEGPVESAPDAELEADADAELETDGETDSDGDPEADAESEADGHADPELDPEGEGLTVLVPAVPDGEGEDEGEVLAEADGDGDGDVDGDVDGVGDVDGDGDGEAEDGKAWQLVSVFGDEVGVCEAGEEAGAAEVGLDVLTTGLSEPARAMAGHAISTAITSKPPASKLSVVALTCVNRIKCPVCAACPMCMLCVSDPCTIRRQLDVRLVSEYSYPPSASVTRCRRHYLFVLV